MGDLPFPHGLPLNTTPYANDSSGAPAGYDGPGECLRHVLGDVAAGAETAESWVVFDQTEFTEEGVGFQESGWAYIPAACATQRCRLLIRPEACAPAHCCCIARSGKLDRARSRLYRGQILQENMRLKALADLHNATFSPTEPFN